MRFTETLHRNTCRLLAFQHFPIFYEVLEPDSPFDQLHFLHAFRSLNSRMSSIFCTPLIFLPQHFLTWLPKLITFSVCDMNVGVWHCLAIFCDQKYKLKLKRLKEQLGMSNISKNGFFSNYDSITWFKIFWNASKWVKGIFPWIFWQMTR